MNNQIRYPAIVANKKSVFTIFFPDFDVRADGFDDFELTTYFATRLLGEILIDYEKSNRTLPRKSAIDEVGADETVIDVNVDLNDYKKRALENEKRVMLEIPIIDSNVTSEKKQIKRLLEFSNIIRNKFFIAIVIAISMALIFGAISNSVQERKEAQLKQEIVGKAEQYLEVSRSLIRDGSYDQAVAELCKIDKLDGIESDRILNEQKALKKYAYLLSIRVDGVSNKIGYQKKLISEISFRNGDEFYEEYKSLKASIEEEYELAQWINIVNTSTDERERREKIASGIPFEGMKESDISSTSVGAYSIKEVDLVYDKSDKYDALYEWDAEPTESFTFPLIVGTANGVVTYVEKAFDLWAWDGDKPLFLDRTYRSRELPKENDEYDAYNYYTGIEFADANQTAFVDIVIRDLTEKGIYSQIDKDVVQDYAWIKAFDYWLSVQKYRVINQKQVDDDFQDVVNNSQN